MSLFYLAPSKCLYTPVDILYYLVNGWPPEPSSSTDTPSQHMVSPHMVGETALLVSAEIELRIESCGKAGKSLRDPFREGTTHDARLKCDIKPWFCPMHETCPGKKAVERARDCEPRNVLIYVSGICRRIQSCDRCLSKKCKKRGRIPYTFKEWLNHR